MNVIEVNSNKHEVLKFFQNPTGLASANVEHWPNCKRNMNRQCNVADKILLPKAASVGIYYAEKGR